MIEKKNDAEKTAITFSAKKYITAVACFALAIVCVAFSAGTNGTDDIVSEPTDTVAAQTEAVAPAQTEARAAADMDYYATMGSTPAMTTARAFVQVTSQTEETVTVAIETEVVTQQTKAETSQTEESADEHENFVEVTTVKAASKSTEKKVKTRAVAPDMHSEAEEIAMRNGETVDISEISSETSAEQENIELEERKSVSQIDAVSKFDVPEWLLLDENGVPSEYVEAITGKSCAYTAEPDALMSTGKEVFQGYVAVDPDVIPYGSELYIVAEDGEVYGYAIAADTGYSVRKGHIVVDLFMNEYDDCIQWGAKQVTIYVLRTNEE